MWPESAPGDLLDALVDGERGAGLDVRDRGLHYGDGLFETMAVRDGAIPLWNDHMRRLEDGCARLRLPPPDAGLLGAEAGRLCAALDRGVLKLVLTRGPGARGYRIARAAVRPTRLLLLYRAPVLSPEYWRSGVTVRVCDTRLGGNPALAGIKHLNRLEQVLARDEWADQEIFEGLMRDREGGIVDGTMSNVFLRMDTVLRTPAVTECGVAGVMRARVMNIAAQYGLRTETGRIDPEQMEAADEIFLSNALFGVLPVARLGDRIFPPGPIALQLARSLSAFTLAPPLGDLHD